MEHSIQDQLYLRLLGALFAHTSEGGWQSLRYLRLHHLVESLAHLLFMRLYLTHSGDVALGDLVVILHIVLQALVVIVRHFFAGNGADF